MTLTAMEEARAPRSGSFNLSKKSGGGGGKRKQGSRTRRKSTPGWFLWKISGDSAEPVVSNQRTQPGRRRQSGEMDGPGLMMNIPISQAGSSGEDEPSLLVPRCGQSGEDLASSLSSIPRPAQRRRGEQPPPKVQIPLRRFQNNILFLIKS